MNLNLACVFFVDLPLWVRPAESKLNTELKSELTHNSQSNRLLEFRKRLPAHKMKQVGKNYANNRYDLQSQ